MEYCGAFDNRGCFIQLGTVGFNISGFRKEFEIRFQQLICVDLSGPAGSCEVPSDAMLELWGSHSQTAWTLGVLVRDRDFKC